MGVLLSFGSDFQGCWVAGPVAIFALGVGSESLNGLGVASMIGSSWLFYWVAREQVQYVFEQVHKHDDGVCAGTDKRKARPWERSPAEKGDSDPLHDEHSSGGRDDGER